MKSRAREDRFREEVFDAIHRISKVVYHNHQFKSYLSKPEWEHLRETVRLLDRLTDRVMHVVNTSAEQRRQERKQTVIKMIESDSLFYDEQDESPF